MTRYQHLIGLMFYYIEKKNYIDLMGLFPSKRKKKRTKEKGVHLIYSSTQWTKTNFIHIRPYIKLTIHTFMIFSSCFKAYVIFFLNIHLKSRVYQRTSSCTVFITFKYLLPIIHKSYQSLLAKNSVACSQIILYLT